MVRLNITMPEDLAEDIADIQNKSRFIAEALREKLKRQKEEQLERSLKEAYQELAQEDKHLNQEWEGVTLEGWPE